MISIKLDEAKVKIESLSEKEYLELLRLKKEIDEGIDYFHEHADSETLENIRKYKDNLNETENHPSADNYNDQKTNEIPKNLKHALLRINRFMTAVQRKVNIDPGRLMGLTDGIFGMVMTLLIFSITIPDITSLSSANFLFSHEFSTTIGITIVSFVLLGSFWIYHHDFLNTTSVNIPYLWLNILFLGSISFIPFTTSLVGNYPHYFQPNFLFGVNLLITLASFILLYKYADHMNYLEKKHTPEEKRYLYNTVYIIMILTVMVIILDCNTRHHFVYLYFFVPIISIIRDTKFKLNH